MRVTRLAGALLCAAALACDDNVAPQFVIEGTGTLEGLVFFDADRNEAYDPSAGDDVVPGATVLVRERGTEQTLSGAEAVTGLDGRFRIGDLPAGTHDLFIDTMTVPEGLAFCRNPLAVSIRIGLVRFAPVTGRQGCVIPILDAEALGEGEVVTIQGIVTVAPGQLRTAGDNAYIEDESGGILLFGGDLSGRGIEIGDRIEVTAQLTLFNKEFEAGGTTANPQLRVNQLVKNVTVPQPRAATTAEVAAAGSPNTAPLQGRLVLLSRARQASAFTLPGNRNALFNDGSGPTEVRIESGLIANSADVATTFPYNAASPKCYDITGVVGSFELTAQVKPRTVAEMREVPCSQ